LKRLDGKGKGVWMLKDNTTRKRKRKEMEETKEEEAKLNSDKGHFLLECKRLKKDFSELELEVINLRGEAQVKEGLANIYVGQGQPQQKLEH